MLGKEDEKKVEALQQSIEQLRRAGNYTAAIEPAGQVLAIHEKTLGSAHWQTADARRAIETLKHIASLPIEGRNAMASVSALEDQYSEMRDKARFAGADTIARELLAIRERWLGADHGDTATSYYDLADNMDAQGKYAEAEPLFQKALAIRLKAQGADHPDTAISYTGLAANLNTQGKYAEAEPLLQKALAIDLKALGADHPSSAINYNNLAVNLAAQGKYAEAEPLLQRALAIRVKAPGADHPRTAPIYKNLAHNLAAQGKYAEAEPLFQKALAIRLKELGADHPETATSYNSLAANLNAQGKYAEAQTLFQKALAIDLKALGADHPNSATSYYNLAVNLDAQGMQAEAEPIFQKALAIRLKALGADHPDTAESYNGLAVNLKAQGKYAEAETLCRKALAIRLKAQGADHPDTAISYNNLAANLNAQGKYAEAEPLFQKALAIRLKELGADHPETATSYNRLADNLDAQGRLDEAIRSWKKAADGFAGSRSARSTTGLERALMTNISPRSALAIALARQGQARDAWEHWEAQLARGLLDDLSARQLRPLTADQRQRETDLIGQFQAFDEQIGRLVAKSSPTQDEDKRLDLLRQRQGTLRGQFVALENQLTAQYREFAGKPATLDEIRTALPADAALVGWVDLNAGGPLDRHRSAYHWACVIRPDGDPHWVPTPGTGPERTWTQEDDRRPNTLRDALLNNSPDWRDLAAALAKQRLVPLRPQLKDITHLIVLPSPALAGVPIDALMAAQPDDSQGPTISYAPSATMFARLSRPRTGPAGLPRLLALGDPAFPLREPETTPPPPPDHGIALLRVEPNGLAGLAGLKAGDVLLQYNGTDLKAASDLKTVPAEAGAQSIPVQYWRRGEVRTAAVAAGKLGIQHQPGRKAVEVVLAQRAADEVLKPLSRGATLERLPGTRHEVEAIAALFPNDRMTTLLGEQATESAFQRIVRKGDLKTYRFLHLATHGKANPNVAMSSALFLAPDPDRSADSTALDTDGQITAQQIVNTWDLDADLVVLSACESGLGHYAGGEGYLGFTQALFVKGARSVVLSLWKVDDRATSLLMRRFYENLLGKRLGLTRPQPKAEALAEAKAWLRGLDATQAEQVLADAGLARGERKVKTAPSANPARPFEHPYYWAAFVLVGDPN